MTSTALSELCSTSIKRAQRESRALFVLAVLDEPEEGRERESRALLVLAVLDEHEEGTAPQAP